MKIKIDTRFDSPDDLVVLGNMLLGLAKSVVALAAPEVPLSEERRAEAAMLSEKRYAPFTEGTPFLAQVAESVKAGNEMFRRMQGGAPEVPTVEEDYLPFSLAEHVAPVATVNTSAAPPEATFVPTPVFVQPLPPGAPMPVVELDSTGTPWDGRIHSVGRSKVANGTWRLRRGVDDAAVKAVESQHQFAATVPPVPAAAVMSFGALMQRITALAVSGEMTPGEVAKTLRDAGLPAIPALASRPDLIGDAARALGFLP